VAGYRHDQRLVHVSYLTLSIFGSARNVALATLSTTVTW
jgi:hypothetical protein